MHQVKLLLCIKHAISISIVGLISADERSTELSKQRKRMRLLRDMLDGLLGWRLCVYIVMNEHKRSLPNPGKKFSY